MGGGMGDSTKAGPGGKAGLGGGMGAAGMGGGPGGGMGGGPGGGMGAGMGEMMRGMGKPTNRELYPTMMQLPETTPAQRADLNQLAGDRINEGNSLLTLGMEDLKVAIRNHDFSATEEANARIRQGQRVLESGLVARLTLAANRNPQLAAFQWFRQDMNLNPTDSDSAGSSSGLSLFHYIVMVTLIVFAVVMVWMYFQKMKRANALVDKLAGKGPGNTPPPAGSPPPPPISPPVANPAVSAPAPITPGATPAAPLAPAKSDLVAVNAEDTPSKPNAWEGTLLVAKIFEETPTVRTLRLTNPAGGKLPFNFVPGQFLTVTVIPNGAPVTRSYSMSSSPTHREYCELTIKKEDHGVVSQYMDTQVHEGESLQFIGPSGRFTFTESDADSIVLIAGGVGVTPFMSIIRYLTDHSWKKDIFLFFTCKNEVSIIFRDEIEYLRQNHPNFHVYITLTKPGHKPKAAYHSGRLTKAIIAEHVPDIASRRVHICGPKPMNDAVEQMLDELDVPKENIKLEDFATPVAAPKKAAPTEADQPPAPAQPPTASQLPTPAAAAPAPAQATATSVPEQLPARPPPSPDPAGITATPPVPDQPPARPPPAPDPATTTAVATFAKSNKTAILPPDKSVLEASEDIGVNIDYVCRVGVCGVCKVNLLSGSVTMAVQDALTDDDKTKNIILACQAKATADVTVDA